MEGIDHVHIVQIHGGGLISQIYGVLEGEIPHGEGLKLGIPRMNASLLVMIKLAETGASSTKSVETTASSV